jgi:hypothetical protein
MHSQFLKDRFERRFPLPMLFFEKIGADIQACINAGEEDPPLHEVVRSALVRCEIHADPAEVDIVYAAERLLQLQNELTEEPQTGEDKSNRSSKRGFATGYLKWLSDMTPEKVCLYLADYDWDAACDLYCRVDRDVVYDMLMAKGESDWQGRVVSFEACLFGFGGSYGSGGDAEEVDIKDMSQDQLSSELATFGF